MNARKLMGLRMQVRTALQRWLSGGQPFDWRIGRFDECLFHNRPLNELNSDECREALRELERGRQWINTMGQGDYEYGQRLADKVISDLEKQFGADRVRTFFASDYYEIALAMLVSMRKHDDANRH